MKEETVIQQGTEEAYIADKYSESFNYLQDRKKRQVQQLNLLNNLQRGDENIGSTLLLTLFNRIMSNLYDDKMQIKFVPGEELDQKKVNSMNILAQNDYREMGKDELDYDWCWDALFFGRGYMETLRFDKKRKIMQPHVINPLVFGYDPYFDKPSDWRYYWKWVTKNKWELIKLIEAGVITGVKDVEEISAGIDPYVWDYKVQRDKAKKVNQPPIDTEDVYQILEFYGYDDDGDKSVYWIDRDFTKILYKEKLDLKDGDDIVAPNGQVIKTNSRWPIVVKEAFKEPHSSVSLSIADLLEDKHRAKAVLLNLAYIAAKDKANPLYVYNPDKVNDVTSLFSREINQHISVSDTSGGAIAPLNTQEPLSQGLIAFMQVLTAEANDPVGTGMALQPVKKGKASATETAIQQQLNDLAQSLQSKVMQFGEKEFWSHWYHRYRANTKEGDEKIATITGVKGMTFEKIDLGDLKTKYPPGVLVLSSKEAEYKELVLRRDLMQMYPQFQESLGPSGIRNFNKYVFFPKFLSDPTIVDLIIPKTLDEIKAEDENDIMKDNTMPNVLDTDDHEQHLYVHQMAKKTWATWTHMAWHEELLAMKKKQEMEAAAQQAQGGKPSEGSPGGGQKPKVDKNKQDDKEATAPLKQEMQPKGKKLSK